MLCSQLFGTELLIVLNQKEPQFEFSEVKVPKIFEDQHSAGDSVSLWKLNSQETISLGGKKIQ